MGGTRRGDRIPDIRKLSALFVIVQPQRHKDTKIWPDLF